MAQPRPNRRIGVYDVPFWDYTKSHELRLQKCDDCGKFRWPPAPVCDKCLSDKVTWTKVRGAGKLKAWITFHRQYFPELAPPVNIILVELAEGPLFISDPVDIAVKDMKENMPVKLTWIDCEDKQGQFGLPVFARA